MGSSSGILAELIVTGPDPGQHFRQQLIHGQTVRIGRAPQKGWAIPWDRSISREHADLLWQDERLTVVCLPNATNPIRRGNEALRQMTAINGDMFQIGQTKFQVVAKTAAPGSVMSTMVGDDLGAGSSIVKSHELLTPRSPREAPLHAGAEAMVALSDRGDEEVEEYTFYSDDLKKVSFGDTVRQVEVLSHLPELIATAKSDVDLALMLVGQLLQAIPTAVATAVVQFDDVDVERQRTGGPDVELPKPKTMRIQTRDNFEGRFTPSRRLLRRALKGGQSVMHIVNDGDAEQVQATMSGSLGWAFCSPITAENCEGWCLYVSGEGTREGNAYISEDMLKGDLRFTELVAQFLGSVLSVKSLQEQKTQLSSFFSPKVINSLTSKSKGNILEPSERDITVLFCDVRGFSRKAEQLQDNLLKLLDCVKAALSAMTGGILAYDGAIADFQGDAALGFWGWPVALVDGPISACRAALTIQQVFSLPDELLEGFSCGVGIAHGRAVAGQIGTAQQAKIGVFGPVVNQGSRIEGLTRQMGVRICVDETTANFVRKHLNPDEARVRRLARVRPKGMATPILVHELLPGDDCDSKLNEAALQAYESAVDAVIAGHWSEAVDLLKTVPSEDGPTKFLLDQMAASNGQPPADWDGAFTLTNK